MNVRFRPGAGRAGRFAFLVLAVGLAGCGAASETSGGTARGAPASAGPTYSLMQMNLCLSGLGGCKGNAAYPAVVTEAIARIRRARPDAVTVNEACQGDLERIARRTGYHMRFSTVIYLGKLLPCVRPGGRGLFGDAVLTKAPVERSDNREFVRQAGIERRRWLCVATRAGVDVCTAHLNTLSSVEAAANAAQCAELGALLARRATARAVIFGGDVNRHGSCAPSGDWTRTDRASHQAPGLQHVYGSRALRAPSAEVLPARNTDHDILLVRARLTAPR